LGDATGERRPPNVARTKHVPQTLDSAWFGNGLGDATGDALIRWHGGSTFPFSRATV
jgi:hypothetical protein